MGLTDDDPIWYAAYGSNCRAARFATYLTGGRAPGSTRDKRGARDPTPPRRSAACWFPSGVRFLGHSAKWGGGGVAFLDHAGGPPAPGRRYLVTKSQFDDIVAQESGRDVRAVPVDRLAPGVVTAIGDGPYDGILPLDPIDGVPVVTFTSPEPWTTRPTSPPAAAYVGTILRGLLEVHTAEAADIVAAVLAAPGVGDGWTAATLTALLEK